MTIARKKKTNPDGTITVKSTRINKAGWYDGHYFRSLIELERYKVLKEREAQGVIHDLKCQPRYVIRNPDTGEIACTYVADFSYLNSTFNQVVEDTKSGVITREYKVKVRMVQVMLGVHVDEVKGRPVTRNKQVVGYRWKVNGVLE